MILSLYPEFVKKALNLYSEKERMMQRCMTMLRYGGVTGDYLEFGVWEGNSFITAYKEAERNGFNGMEFYAFDSFEGLPGTDDIDIYSVFKQGDFCCSEEQFKKNLVKARVDMKKVRVVKGWYDKVLTKELKDNLNIWRAAVVLVDCDLYSSAKAVLDFCTGYVQDGTVICFDDWFCFGGSPFMGEQKAFNDWLKKNQDIIAIPFYKFHTLGNSFILHRRV